MIFRKASTSIRSMKKPGAMFLKHCLRLSTSPSGKGCNKEYVTMALTKRNLRTNNNKELLRKKIQKNCFVYFSLSAKHILYCCLLISHIPLFQFFVVVAWPLIRAKYQTGNSRKTWVVTLNKQKLTSFFGHAHQSAPRKK